MKVGGADLFISQYFGAKYVLINLICLEALVSAVSPPGPLPVLAEHWRGQTGHLATPICKFFLELLLPYVPKHGDRRA